MAGVTAVVAVLVTCALTVMIAVVVAFVATHVAIVAAIITAIIARVAVATCAAAVVAIAVNVAICRQATPVHKLRVVGSPPPRRCVLGMGQIFVPCCVWQDERRERQRENDHRVTKVSPPRFTLASSGF